MSNPDVIVVGAGVIGLTTAIRLQEAGATVRIRTAELTADTTSAAATGMCGPVFQSPTATWEMATVAELRRIAGPETGVRLETGLGAVTAKVGGPPPLADESMLIRAAKPEELPAGYHDGMWMRVPLVDLPVYLDYLVTRFTGDGGKIEQRMVETLELDAELVVNCSGVGARKLAGDPSVRPVKGQHVVVENPGLDGFFLGITGRPENAGWHTYGKHVLLGGVRVEGDWDPAPSPEIAAGILRRCVEIEPRFADAKVMGHRAGLRPCRPSVRLEAEVRGSTKIVHNYGHDGSGVLQSWGCADEAAALLLG
ncbi:FAD-dependent oxidoreductase [Fodinicola acaciae]|uniref:FAD-dependent oxidoreductase n=1 Tax=Fodinicola acaciae TaxID=2681555 RepID=UPI0013D245FF|nr:FAD-dependent oxidoreductase [Fodinicola acaciae]